jgi:hypothetical protein
MKNTLLKICLALLVIAGYCQPKLLSPALQVTLHYQECFAATH